MIHPLRPPPSGFQWVGRRAFAALVLGGALLLGACSPPASELATADARHDYVASVPITAADTRASVETAHNADVVVWRPDAGFAVLGLREGSSGLATLGKRASNQDAITAPEANAAGVSAWAGGVSAWAGGVSAWAGGVSAWAGGTLNPFPGNEGIWSQIRLAGAQARAPKLGGGVTVAVIDTGVDLAHPALQGKLAPQSQWRDFVDGDGWPAEVAGDSYGHGTAVAGIVLQAAPEATILPIRALGPNGSGDVTTVVQAIDHAVSAGAQVINLSLGTGSYTAALDDIVNYANGQNVYVVASSGNTGDTRVTYPAHDTKGSGALQARRVGVGSVNAADQRSSFSTYGSNLEMVAPGEGVRTLYPNAATTHVSGTSFAAPWVSGALALKLGQTGSWDDPWVGHDLDISSDWLASSLGNGRLNASRFLDE